KVPRTTPTSPLIMELLHVTAVPARTAKFCADPSGDWADALEALRAIAAKARITMGQVLRRREAQHSIMRTSLHWTHEGGCPIGDTSTASAAAKLFSRMQMA